MKYKKILMISFVLLSVVFIAGCGEESVIPKSEDQLSINKTLTEEGLLNKTENMALESKIDPKIIEALETQDRVRIIVRLKGEVTKEEILSQIPTSEYTFIGDLTTGFVIEITQKGFDILSQDLHIKKVYLSMPVHATSTS